MKMVLLGLLLIIPFQLYGDELDDFEQELQGHWQQVATRKDTEGATYQNLPKEALFTKVYIEGHFHAVYRWAGGRVDSVFGGRYEVIEKGKVQETIEYYLPKDKRYVIEGSGGNAIFFSGKSMVGAENTFDIVLAGNQMELKGVFMQNVTSVNNPESFGHKVLNYKFKKMNTKNGGVEK